MSHFLLLSSCMSLFLLSSTSSPPACPLSSVVEVSRDHLLLPLPQIVLLSFFVLHLLSSSCILSNFCCFFHVSSSLLLASSWLGRSSRSHGRARSARSARSWSAFVSVSVRGRLCPAGCPAGVSVGLTVAVHVSGRPLVKLSTGTFGKGNHNFSLVPCEPTLGLVFAIFTSILEFSAFKAIHCFK